MACYFWIFVVDVSQQTFRANMLPRGVPTKPHGVVRSNWVEQNVLGYPHLYPVDCKAYQGNLLTFPSGVFRSENDARNYVGTDLEGQYLYNQSLNAALFLCDCDVEESAPAASARPARRGARTRTEASAKKIGHKRRPPRSTKRGGQNSAKAVRKKVSRKKRPARSRSRARGR